MAEPFPDDVRRFLLETISSVEQLEVLLLLKAEPTKSWTAAAVGQALYTSTASAQARLADLTGRGYVASDGAPEPQFRYTPVDAERARVVDLVETTYRERRVAVISLIYSKPSDQVQAFANAFHFRKDS